MKSFVYIILMVLCIVGFTRCTDQSVPKATQGPEPKNEYDAYQRTSLNNGIERAIKKDESGQIIEEGLLENNQKVGVWTTYKEKKITSLTSYANGSKYGKSYIIDHRLQIQEEKTYKNDALEGSSGKYKRGRPLEQGHYVNGKPHGTFNAYYESGKYQGSLRQSVEYKNGVIHGKAKYYDEAGNLTAEYLYKNGSSVKQIQ